MTYSNWISVAVGPSPDLIVTSYNVAAISKWVDLINLMTYDYSTAWGGYTGLSTPFTAFTETVNAWVANGADKKKLLLGLHFYANSYTLADEQANTIGALVHGKGTFQGPLYDPPGFVLYPGVCLAIQEGAWEFVYVPNEMSGYVYKDDQWYATDNIASIEAKTEWATSFGLGGVMIWTVDADDESNQCHTGKFPLLHAVERIIRRLNH